MIDRWLVSFASKPAKNVSNAQIYDDHILFEAGLFESKIRIRYACVHLGGLQRRYLALTRSSIMLIVLGWVGVASCFHVSSLLG